MAFFERLRAFFRRASGGDDSRDATSDARSIDEESGAEEPSDDPDRTAGNRRPAHFIPFYR
jgi:hypothetical protein